ncbi:M16 family metallopeptidase [Aurantibacillus circumpalustris]|uniref:M16 family metallopeptidase n=1 Tax=Aurantibacillus circumpalustris TaxID=3036359 RepID=UPI00295A86C6|nr:pitrilysin family protein [Aurantibacillus circumpalustris]
MQKILVTGALLFVGLMEIKAQKTHSNSNNQLGATPVFIEEVKKSGNEIVIPYKQYKLSNGLTILIHEDHSDPICYVDVTYHVGSAREQQGRSGFAHFFEHMMFQGSKNVADEQHFKIITESGGTLNGSTNTDRTNYFETVPSNQLEKMLWLEADRMGFLLDSVTQRKFEVQRATVKNERGQRYDNAPYGLVSEKIGEALYPQGHPYSWTTIGYIVDLDRVDVNDLKRFYMRWYGANNAVLTVAGDVNTEEVLVMAQKYFGNIDKGPEVKTQIVAPFKLESNSYISYEDNVKFPMLNIAYPSSPLYTKDDAALDVLAEVLSGSQGSPLYKAFIESKKAVSVNAYQYSRELSGQFQIAIRANSSSALADIEKDLKTALNEWEKKGVSDDDLIKFKTQFQSNLYNRLSTVQGKGASLASYYTLAKNPNNLKNEIERYTSLTKEDVMRVYTTYIKGKNTVILSCVPKGKSDAAAQSDTWKMYDRKIETESDEYKNLSYVEAKDNFNRSIMPKAKAATPVSVPDFYTTKLFGKIPLIGITENEIPKVNVLITFKLGHRFEEIGKAGIAQLLASMLEQSSQKTSAEEIENKLNRLGSSVNIYSGDEDFNISIQALKENLTATLKIVEESFFEPKFDPTEFELEKKKQLDGITQMQTNASALAEMAYRRVLYGPNHIMSLPSNGTSETVNSIGLEDVKEYFNRFNSGSISVAVSGQISKDQIITELKFLNKLLPGGPAPTDLNLENKIENTKIYFVDKKNAAQSEIRIGYMAMPFDATGEFYKCNIMNFSFAGAFNSRTNYLLREVKGWTYGTRGSFNGTKYPGAYTISGGFKSNTTDSTLKEFFAELKKYSENGITNDELTFTKNAMTQSDALKYESPLQKLGFIKRVLEYQLPKDYVAKQTAILNTITKAEINTLAKKYLPYKNMIVVVVGDKASNFEKVKKLGFDVVEIDVDGNEVK